MNATPHTTIPRRERWLRVHAVIAVNVALLLVAIWLLTTPGERFWPAWVALVLTCLLVAHAGVAAATAPARRARVGDARLVLDVSAAIVAAVVALLWGLWLLGGPWEIGVPWPVWPTVALLFALAAIATPAQLRAVDAAGRRRIDQLTRTRADVLESQELELRRIERDLHDGAQARLVLLGMQLGQLEQAVGDDAALGERVVEARSTVADAQRDLRDLARGIYPPVLADRGLVAAVESLAAAAAGTVTVAAEVDGRLPAAVEGACYFVVAEALANSVKHADAASIDVHIVRDAHVAVVTVTDDGVGGVDVSGSGIEGMRRRVEALDGSLVVTSPTGGPTTVRMEVPCGS